MSETMNAGTAGVFDGTRGTEDVGFRPSHNSPSHLETSQTRWGIRICSKLR
jgi:hypothetical protein